MEMSRDYEQLTSEQIALIGYVRQGMSVEQAIRMAGGNFEDGLRFLTEDERGIAAIQFNGDLSRASVSITKDLITAQLYEERARSTNTMEGVACLKEIAKIHGLYENKVSIKTSNDDGTESKGEKTVKQIQRLDDDAIIRELDSTGVVIDLEPTKVR